MENETTCELLSQCLTRCQEIRERAGPGYLDPADEHEWMIEVEMFMGLIVQAANAQDECEDS